MSKFFRVVPGTRPADVAIGSAVRRSGARTEIVIASTAKQSTSPPMRRDGLLRRFAPLRKRFTFVAGNDGEVRILVPAIRDPLHQS
jgi:hypothetical protein